MTFDDDFESMIDIATFREYKKKEPMYEFDIFTLCICCCASKTLKK